MSMVPKLNKEYEMARDDDFSNEETSPEAPQERDSGKQDLMLRREAVMSSERQRGTLITTLCTLAGVGMGFGLGQLVTAQNQNNNCTHHHQVMVSERRAPVHAKRARHIQDLAWLGVRVQDSVNAKQPGALVRESIAGSPAHSLGLTGGDLVLSLDSVQITSANSLIRTVQSRKKGQVVHLRWQNRRGELREANMALGAISRQSLRQLR